MSNNSNDKSFIENLTESFNKENIMRSDSIHTNKMNINDTISKNVYSIDKIIQDKIEKECNVYKTALYKEMQDMLQIQEQKILKIIDNKISNMNIEEAIKTTLREVFIK